MDWSWLRPGMSVVPRLGGVDRGPALDARRRTRQVASTLAGDHRQVAHGAPRAAVDVEAFAGDDAPAATTVGEVSRPAHWSTPARVGAASAV